MLRTVKHGLLTLLEAVFLLALYMAFVSQWRKPELLFGLLFAIVGAVADGIVKKTGLAKFRPKLSWLALIFLEPWYVLKGSWLTFGAFFRELVGNGVSSKFQVAEYHTTGTDARSSARRALAISYLSIPPNSIIVGIDREKKQALIHHIVPSGPSFMAKELGVDA